MANRGRTFSLSLPPFTKAVKWLVLVNAGVFLAFTVLNLVNKGIAIQARDYLGLIPDSVIHGYLWQLATYSFLHVDTFHILFNMLALWMFGSQLELDWGYKRFLEFYFFCVVGAALTTVGVSYTGFGGVSPIGVTEGASGGIFGILIAFGILYANQEIMLFPIPLSMKAKYFVGGIIFIELISALQSAHGRGEAIAYFAHLGGLVFGAVYVKLIPRRGLGFGASERYFSLRNGYYRWKRRRAARKFEVYMRKHDRTVTFDEHGNYIPPDDDKKNGGSKSGWVN